MEYGICTFNNHFIQVLRSTDPDFPLHLWDHLFPREESHLTFSMPCTYSPNSQPMPTSMGHLTSIAHTWPHLGHWCSPMRNYHNGSHGLCMAWRSGMSDWPYSTTVTVQLWFDFPLGNWLYLSTDRGG